jgi:hypothetical protein
MKAITKFLAGGIAVAALAAAAPAAAQYFPGYPSYGYPGYGYGYPGYGTGNVLGSIINSVTGGYGGYGYNVPGGSRIAASQCTAAVQQRLGGYGYGYGVGGRALSIDSVEITSGGGYRVRGVAAAGGYGYAGGNVGFSCRTDPRGFVVDVRINNGYYGNGYGNVYQRSPYDNPYEVYGYQRY